MTALKTVAVAVGAVVIEVVLLVVIFAAEMSMGRFESLYRPPYWVRASAAVATLGLWFLVGAAPASIALRLGRQWNLNLLGAVFIVAAFNGLALYFVLEAATFANAVAWDVPFPLGGEGGLR